MKVANRSLRRDSEMECRQANPLGVCCSASTGRQATRKAAPQDGYWKNRSAIFEQNPLVTLRPVAVRRSFLRRSKALSNPSDANTLLTRPDDECCDYSKIPDKTPLES